MYPTGTGARLFFPGRRDRAVAPTSDSSPSETSTSETSTTASPKAGRATEVAAPDPGGVAPVPFIPVITITTTQTTTELDTTTEVDTTTVVSTTTVTTTGTGSDRDSATATVTVTATGSKTTTTVTVTATPTGSASNKDAFGGMNAPTIGAIVGCTVAGVIVILGAGFILYRCCLRKRRGLEDDGDDLNFAAPQEWRPPAPVAAPAPLPSAAPPITYNPQPPYNPTPIQNNNNAGATYAPPMGYFTRPTRLAQ
ncbi:hypothetical protein H4R18_005671 [Coemansia javaensis]|uniref:Mid2 domain-containing protein n=1 Tax=Coemansia javaensis TaxID=2761396 RepID=A0A9W8H578_9FUNG|nr:hypothetical protein H4R18_005671 [Coemansia javaensis]